MMCGRFAITLPSDAMAQLFSAQPANNLPDVPNYNVCPTDQIHVVFGGDGGARQLVAMRWGFLPHWYKKVDDGPLLINARGETIAQKPAFREAVRSRRGLVIATGFFEWTKTPEGLRNPWYITRDDGEPPIMAAVWQEWTGHDGEVLRSCALVTTAANTSMARIHHRMPVILDECDWPLWLGESGHGAATLMRPGGEDVLRLHRVDRAVNSNRAAGAELIEPLIDEGDTE